MKSLLFVFTVSLCLISCAKLGTPGGLQVAAGGNDESRFASNAGSGSAITAKDLKKEMNALSDKAGTINDKADALSDLCEEIETRVSDYNSNVNTAISASSNAFTAMNDAKTAYQDAVDAGDTARFLAAELNGKVLAYTNLINWISSPGYWREKAVAEKAVVEQNLKQVKRNVRTQKKVLARKAYLSAAYSTTKQGLDNLMVTRADYEGRLVVYNAVLIQVETVTIPALSSAKSGFAQDYQETYQAYVDAYAPVGGANGLLNTYLNAFNAYSKLVNPEGLSTVDMPSICSAF